MRVVLLAGGLGSRLSEETVRVPKPMVEVNGRPIMLHVMDIYARHGLTDFVVACGYKAISIKRFFHDLHLLENDFTVRVGDGEMRLKPTAPDLATPLSALTRTGRSQADWNVSVVDTGEHTMTGGRLKRLREWIGNEPFMVTYSDGVGNVDIDALLAFHRSHGRVGTVTAVQPPARFGSLEIESGAIGGPVSCFAEKVRTQETWINGGFFVFEPEILDYIEDDSEPLEQEPLRRLTDAGELCAYKHRGFWHPMDTLRDRNHLDALARSANPPWIDPTSAEITSTDAPGVTVPA